MKRFILALGAILGGAILAFPFFASALSVFQYVQGGTGTTTAPIGQVLYGGASSYQSAATTTISGTGITQVSNSPYVIGVSPSIVSIIGGVGGQIVSWVNGVPGWVATTTFSTPLSYSGGIVNCPTCNTSNATVSSIATTWPILGGTITTTGTLSWGGLSTTSNGTKGDLPYWTGVGSLGDVATSTLTASSPLTGSFTQIGSGGSVGCQTASGSQAGCLSSADWTTFNSKSSAAFPFTNNTTFNVPVESTSTALWLNTTANVSLFASTTVLFDDYTRFHATSTPPAAPPSNYGEMFAQANNGITRPVWENECSSFVMIRDNIFTVKNTSGVTITPGQVLTITGSTGNVPNVKTAIDSVGITADAVAVSGIGTANITNNSFGCAMDLGTISSIDTSAFTTGADLYLSTTTAGGLVGYTPVYPDPVQFIGEVLVSGVGNGSIKVKVTSGQHNYDTGTTRSGWSIGSTTTSGARTLVFNNTSGAQTISATPTGNFTLTVPNVTGTFGVGTPTVSQLTYWGSDNGLHNVATTSESCTSPLSCTAHAVLTGGGAISFGGLSSIAANQIIYGNGAGTAYATVATSSLNIGGTAHSLDAALGVTLGGTGISSPTANDIIYFNDAGTAFVQVATSSLNLGINGGGTGLTSITANDIIYGNDAGTSFAQVATSSLHLDISGANAVTGTLAIGNGGTGLASYTANRLIYTNDAASAFAQVATSSETCTSPLSCTSHDVLAGGGAITFGGLSSIAANNIIYGNGAGTAYATVATSSLHLDISGANAVTGTLAIGNGGTGLSSVTANDIIYGNGAGSAYAAVATSSLRLDISGANAVTGTLAVGNGGTGLTSVTANQIIYGNGAGTAYVRVATSTIFGTGLGGQILGWTSGAPGWVGTTTAGTGLTYNAGSPGNFSVNSSQSIATLSNLTNNGYVYTSGGGGTLNAASFTANDIPYVNGAGTGISQIATSTLYGTCVGGQVVGWANGGLGCIATSTSAGSAFPFTQDSNFSQNAVSTTTAIWLKATPISFMASSTSWFDMALASTSGQVGVPSFGIKGSSGTSGIGTTNGASLDFDVGGTRYGSVDSHGFTANLSGSAASPVFTSTAGSSQSNGIFFTSNNDLGFSTNGTEAARFDISHRLGIGTTSPFALLEVASSSLGAANFGQLALTDTNAAANLKHWLFSSLNGFLYIGTTTDAYATSTYAALTLTNSGQLSLQEVRVATSSTELIDWNTTPNQTLVQMGSAAMTINFNNASTTGMTKRIVVCNPSATTAGALTWGAKIEWPGGTIPTQTTAANVCDIWSFIVTQATSTVNTTVKIFGAQSSNFK